MEPGEINPPPFQFAFKEGLPLNWSQMIHQVNVPELLMGQNLESLSATHLNLAYADVIGDPGFVCTEDPEVYKAITLVQLGV